MTFLFGNYYFHTKSHLKTSLGLRRYGLSISNKIHTCYYMVFTIYYPLYTETLVWTLMWQHIVDLWHSFLMNIKYLVRLKLIQCNITGINNNRNVQTSFYENISVFGIKLISLLTDNWFGFFVVVKMYSYKYIKQNVSI